MALFKIFKGNKSGLNTKEIVNGYCYVTLDEQKMYIDHIDNDDKSIQSRFCLNAEKADYVVSDGQTNKFVNSDIEFSNNVIKIDDTNYFDMTSISNGVNIRMHVNENTDVISIYTDTNNQGLALTHNKVYVGDSEMTDSHVKVSNGNKSVTIEPGQITIDNNTTIIGSEFSGNAASATKLDLEDIGSATHPVYFENGIPVETTYELKIAGNDLGLVKPGNSVNVDDNGVLTVKDYEHKHKIENVDGLEEVLDTKANADEYLPLAAGEAYKLSGALGLTEEVMYGNFLPDKGFEGQLFFLVGEENPLYVPIGGAVNQVLTKNSNIDGDVVWRDSSSVPKGGSAGQALIKNSSTDGDASWKDLVALPKGGITGQALVKNSEANGDAIWSSDLNVNAASASKLQTAVNINLTGDVSGTVGFDGSSNVSCTTTVANNSHTHIWSNISDGNSCTINTSGTITGSKVYGAVWNDYAEYRNQKNDIQPGYCVASSDNGKVYKTIERFQACDGIVSDTFGFAIGETEECRTPLAVAGRVLAYCGNDRNEYHAGDAVCAGPGGLIYKMTREEIREWPDRIVGIVSEIPEYNTWGTGNIQVNNRIWIKVK